MEKPTKIIYYWLLLGCLLIMLMVFIGGITRLTGSGLSMVNWGVIGGTLPPLNETQWNEVFDAYKQSPEFIEVNHFFTLADFKSIFWWEYIHRLIGRLLGIVFIVPYVYFMIKKWIPKSLNNQLLVIFLLGALQGFLGWYMVKSGLIDVPEVSHFRLAAHLSCAFLTCSYILWVALGLRNKPKIAVSKGFARWTMVFTILVLVQIVYGAFVAGMKAGYAFNTFPKMGSFWIPPALLESSSLSIWTSSIPGVQFVHRVLGIAIVVLLLLITYLYKNKTPTEVMHKLNMMLILVCGQFLLGLFTLLGAVPTSLALLHQLGAFFLLMFTVYLWRSVYTKPKN